MNLRFQLNLKSTKALRVSVILPNIAVGFLEQFLIRMQLVFEERLS